LHFREENPRGAREFLYFCLSLALAESKVVRYNVDIITARDRKHIHQKRRLKIMKLALKEKGQGMVEYALILVLVAVVVIAAVTIMGPLVGKVFSTVNASL